MAIETFLNDNKINSLFHLSRNYGIFATTSETGYAEPSGCVTLFATQKVRITQELMGVE